MTRFLSDALQAPEPFFRAGLKRLEAANGHPSTDIRFSTEIQRATQTKLRQLGLDPRDTTPEELYHVLQERIKADDARLTKTLRTRAATHVSAEGDVVAGMVHALESLPDTKHCFALKPSALKTIIKKMPPKKAMKQLGYRSLDSFLKHETPASLLAAAWLSEGASWQHRLLGQYKQLRASDFEERQITFLRPSSPRWRTLAEKVVVDQKHNLLSFRELGALVFLPLPADAPSGSTTVSLSLALHELNEIRAGSTFLKLCQVRADFGEVVQKVVGSEPQLVARSLDQDVPWHLIQRYYAGTDQSDAAEIFEPYLRLEDMVWHPIEQTLAAIEPSFAFWQQSAYLGLLDRRQPVSLNVLDAALNYCNRVPFEKRIAQYFQHSLWHELLLKYLHPDTIERTISDELQPQLAEELVEA
ncbi:MAG TPA: hypothetical protein VIJ68_01640 [Candidatus Saccharimonadales bacterium]